MKSLDLCAKSGDSSPAHLGERSGVPCPFGLGATVTLLGLWLLFTGRVLGGEEIVRETQTGKMLTKEGDVNYRPPGRAEVPAAKPQPLGFGDSLRTLQLGRATVRFID